MLVFVEAFAELTHQADCHAGFFQGTHHKICKKDQKETQASFVSSEENEFCSL